MFFYTVFLLFFLTHCYLFIKLRNWLGRGWWQLVALGWFALMLCVWWFRHRHEGSMAVNVFFTVGFTWLGFSIIAAVCLAGLEVARFFCRIFLSQRTRKKGYTGSWLDQLVFLLHPTRAVPLGLCLAVGLSCYAAWEAQAIRPYYVKVVTEKLPPELGAIRVAVISDLHLSRMIGPRAVQKIADITNGADVDLFISLGDLVDTDMARRQADAAIFRSINTKYGKYAVLGNHEFYNGVSQAIRFHEEAGFTLLRGSSTTVAGIQLVGVDDGKVKGAVPLLQEAQKMGQFVLLLAHRPDVAVDSVGLFDLQVSGHLHGGQVWLGSLLFHKLIHKRDQHLSAVTQAEKRSMVFVTNGAGFWGPPMRFLTPPEVAIIDIARE